MKLLILSLAVLSACSAYKGTHTGDKSKINRYVAGHPNYDLKVAHIRQLFREGRIPKRADIPLDKNISCNKHEAGKLSVWVMSNLTDTFNFQEQEDDVYTQPSGEISSPEEYINHFTEKGMQGKFKGSDGYEYALTTRLVEGKDDLIVEIAFKSKQSIFKYSKPYGDHSRYPKSDAIKGYYVNRYLYCPLDSD